MACLACGHRAGVRAFGLSRRCYVHRLAHWRDLADLLRQGLCAGPVPHDRLLPVLRRDLLLPALLRRNDLLSLHVAAHGRCRGHRMAQASLSEDRRGKGRQAFKAAGGVDVSAYGSGDGGVLLDSQGAGQRGAAAQHGFHCHQLYSCLPDLLSQPLLCAGLCGKRYGSRGSLVAGRAQRHLQPADVFRGTDTRFFRNMSQHIEIFVRV